MNNKTILISHNQSNDSLTNFNHQQKSTIEDYKKQKSVFKRRPIKKASEYEISFNPFITAASPLLRAVIQFQKSLDKDNMYEAREELVAKINLYNETASKYGIEENEILVTRYVLCTFTDELLNSTHLGKDNNWSNNSLLSIFHNETYGGENFFHLLDKFLKVPAKYIHILELMYICMALGFEGKYRVIDRGQIELNNIKDGLFRQIKIVQGRDPLTFYTTQEPSKDKYRLFNKISYPMLILSIFTLLLIVYSSLTFSLHQQDEEFINLLSKDYKAFQISDLEESN
ncbi:type IVB secretion system protein IcmH/DotU [Arcobacter sp. LA11]|uniref:type IVB secretion system protein IcmH/DotU n=1 Tax=Arcobacter sp. LA11 TaxID=1898176 RepID=UPI000933ECA5|nr:type IVB secretion system protein IcmH/DotU [Arcobacter sp. LA11]